MQNTQGCYFSLHNICISLGFESFLDTFQTPLLFLGGNQSKLAILSLTYKFLFAVELLVSQEFGHVRKNLISSEMFTTEFSVSFVKSRLTPCKVSWPRTQYKFDFRYLNKDLLIRYFKKRRKNGHGFSDHNSFWIFIFFVCF